MLQGLMCPSNRCQMSTSAVTAYTTPGTSSWDSLGFAEQLILRVALEHDVERAHLFVARVLFERNDDVSDGQMRAIDLQHESNSVLQLGCWGEDIACEAWCNQRVKVDRELGAVAVADGERDEAVADSTDWVFPGGCDLFRRLKLLELPHPFLQP